jgi:hypothetical protein
MRFLLYDRKALKTRVTLSAILRGTSVDGYCSEVQFFAVWGGFLVLIGHKSRRPHGEIKRAASTPPLEREKLLEELV